MADEPMTTTTAEGNPFIKITLPDGSTEMRHPEYDRLKEAGKNAPAVDPVPMSEEEVAAGRPAQSGQKRFASCLARSMPEKSQQQRHE